MIGIVGGMGPMAGLRLHELILAETVAHKDQDHLPILHLSMPAAVPDRTAYLVGDTDENPAYAIAAMLQKLEFAGAEVAGIACNTSHSRPILRVIEEEIERLGLGIRLLSIVDATLDLLKKQVQDREKVAFWGTNGTWLSGMYDDAAMARGFNVLRLPKEQQEKVHSAIYDPHFGLKANVSETSNEAIDCLGQVGMYCKKHGVKHVVLACTELALAIDEETFLDLRLLDSNRALARSLVEAATQVVAPQILKEK